MHVSQLVAHQAGAAKNVMSTKTTKLSNKNKQLIQKFNNMRQFIITQKAFRDLVEVGETYDAIRSQFPSMDIEKYLSLEHYESIEEKANHAQLLLWIYIHEEHYDVLYAKVKHHSHEDLNRVLITIDADKLESVEPRLFKNNRIESLIGQGILQEVTFIPLTPKDIEDLTYILGFVKRGYYEENGNYGNLNNFLNLELSQAQLDHMITKFKQEN